MAEQQRAEWIGDCMSGSLNKARPVARTHGCYNVDKHYAAQPG